MSQKYPYLIIKNNKSISYQSFFINIRADSKNEYIDSLITKEIKKNIDILPLGIPKSLTE